MKKPILYYCTDFKLKYINEAKYNSKNKEKFFKNQAKILFDSIPYKTIKELHILCRKFDSSIRQNLKS